jgi:hypothetical protein
MVNSDNHGQNARQNVLLGSGVVEYRDSVINKLGKLDGKKLQDNDIYSLNPEIPRAMDGYLRHTGNEFPPAGESNKENPPGLDNSGAGQCVLIGAGTIEFRDVPDDKKD